MKHEEMKILVVEDNPADARLIQMMLDPNGGGGFKLLVEPSLENALRQLSETEIDAVLLDLSLPGTSGLETLAKIYEADSITPIIVLTGLDDEEAALQAVRLGAQDYLLKDKLDAGHLAQTLRYSVERGRHDLLGKYHSMETGLRRSLNLLSRFSPTRPAFQNSTVKKGSKFKTHSHFDSLDLPDLLREERVEAHFQPWVSVKNRSVVGFEGLCRGINGNSEELISPVTLLMLARRHTLLGDLDRLFRKKVLETFEAAFQWNPDLVLSVNFDTSVLNGHENPLDDLASLLGKQHLDPAHIAIEILESHAIDSDRLKRLIEAQREMGFLIALDDIGVGYSDLDRIAALEPDLIKTDRALVQNIHQSYHQQEVFKSLVKMSHGIGALVVAEGVETEMEAMRVLELGADMIQGFYFSEPQPLTKELLTGCEEKIDDLAGKFKSRTVRSINAKKKYYREYDEMVWHMTGELSLLTPKSFDTKLVEILVRHPKVECLYILDEAGTQMTRLIRNSSYLSREKAFFKTPSRGADHSLKDYYYNLIESDLKEYTYVTEPYLSLATGKLCRTISTLFKDAYGHTYVLCVDIKPGELPN